MVNAAGLSEFRLCPIVPLGDADVQPKAVQRVVEEGPFDRQLDGLVEEANAPAHTMRLHNGYLFRHPSRYHAI